MLPTGLLRTRRDDVSLLDITVPAVTEVVPRLRHLVRDFSAAVGADAATQADIALCVTEAIANSVRYAYPEAHDGDVRLTVDHADGAIEIVVEDAGGGIREDNAVAGGIGQGLTLIAALAARFSIDEVEGGGTRVWMRFHLSGSSSRAADEPASSS